MQFLLVFHLESILTHTLTPTHTTVWINMRTKEQKNALLLLIALNWKFSWKCRRKKQVVFPPEPFANRLLPPVPLLPLGRYFLLVNHSACIRKHYLCDHKIAASLLEPQPAVRWISPKAPKPFHFITMSLLILTHINHKDTFFLGYEFNWTSLSTW